MALLNIFTKKPLKEKETQTIIIDNREKNSLVAAELIAQKNKVEFKHLEVADYIIGDTAIERKTISDFISSMLNKRIFSQLKNLQQYNKSLFIIENYNALNLSGTNLNENAIKGLILSISLDYKVPIIFSKSPKETAQYFSLLAKKKKTRASLRSKIKKSDHEILQFVLEGFPGIGPKTSQVLLEKYKTVKQVINASEAELTSLLGKKKAEKFLYFLHKIYKE